MKIIEIKELLNTNEYDFLRTNEHLGDNIILLTLGGSYAYGTNTENSDIDIRGVCLNRSKELLGLSNFEQVVNVQTDTTIYAFNKLISLLINCNPNTIELLGTKSEHVFKCTPEGQLLKDNINLFLTQRCLHSFGGYVIQQLRRLQNALARDEYPQEDKEQHILGSIKSQFPHLQTHYNAFTNEDIKIYLDDTERENFKKEIFIDINLKHYPLRDFANIKGEMLNIVKIYNKLNHRNRKKDSDHLNKHAQHLIRLYLMLIDILEGKGVNTYRKNDRQLLLNIKNGNYEYKEIFEMVNELEKKVEYATKHTELPKKPNMKLIEEFVMNINRRVV